MVLCTKAIAPFAHSCCQLLASASVIGHADSIPWQIRPFPPPPAKGIINSNPRLSGNAGLQGSVKPALLKILKGRVGQGTTIVYCTFQMQADEIAGYLYVNGIAAASYHAGKSDQVGEFSSILQDCLEALHNIPPLKFEFY